MHIPSEDIEFGDDEADCEQLTRSVLFPIDPVARDGDREDGAERPFGAAGASPWQPPDQHSRLRLAASVFANSHDAILITDPSGRIIDVNPAFHRHTGYRASQVLGKTPAVLQSGLQNELFYAQMWQQLRLHGAWRGEISNRDARGNLCINILSISAVRDSRGDLTHYVAVYADITSLRHTQKRLEHLAHHDPLTGLPNRVLLADRIALALSQRRRYGGMFAVCFLDLDRFKPINDQLGHDAGDQILKAVSQRLKNAMRETDTVARLGGDEFALLLTDISSAEDLIAKLDSLLSTLAEPYPVAGTHATLSASLGYTLVPDDDDTPDALLRHADQAMYQAKLEGRNRIARFDIAQHRHLTHLRENQTRIAMAIRNGELCLHYQPKVDMRRGQVIGVEALVRWNHPERGILPPGQFIAAISEHRLLDELGDWVIACALAQMQQWASEGIHLRVSVNVAGQHLMRGSFFDSLRAQLTMHPGVQPSLLELEILETTALDDLAHVSYIINRCRTLGVEFAIDDFGTGYASLLYLKQLPARTLKIDRSFLRDLLDSSEGLEAFSGITGLGRAFRRDLVAEGVEDHGIGAVLLRLRCDIAQGYGIARPMPAEQLRTWLREFVPDPLWSESLRRPWRLSDYPLLCAIAEQRQVVSDMERAVRNRTPVDAPYPGLFADSRLGRWFFGIGKRRYGDLSQWRAVPEQFLAVQRASARLVMRLQRNDRQERLDSLLQELNQLSAELVKTLDLLWLATIERIPAHRQKASRARSGA